MSDLMAYVTCVESVGGGGGGGGGGGLANKGEGILCFLSPPLPFFAPAT